MASIFCPFCGSPVGNPAWHFCPSCGSRLPESAGQDRTNKTEEKRRRILSGLLFAAGILLIVIAAAVLVQSLNFIQTPGQSAVNGSLPSFSVHQAVNETGPNTTIPVPSPVNPEKTEEFTGPGLHVNTTINTTASQATSVFTGPVFTVTGTPSFISMIPAPGRSEVIPIINATSLAMRVHELVNKQRQEHQLAALGMDPVLGALARAHSEDMAKNGYFGHVNLQEMDPTARGAAAGYLCQKDYDTYYTYGIAENIFATYRYGSVIYRGSRETDYDWKTEEVVANETVDAWMNSPDHRANILDEGMRREGIGVAVGNTDLVFVTEDFC